MHIAYLYHAYIHALTTYVDCDQTDELENLSRYVETKSEQR